ncbi:DUF262 domain-containing protein [Saccharopolyspora endophytica]|uniref:DUF262 domain-containing protein n=1 Tax=Saccharopolyspora endophytica TaxID=543886 RepID=A0ABS5DI31_9PSEU|nr:DUF262 domain-containing protein [Saccharopolyspora endophytica]MBQ0925944.1 DUF262 domain-containing protein [Saccharopolyspora endophytica]
MADDTAGVDLIPIKSETRTIQKCFQYCLYDVPNFQREYSWTSDQLADFWNDVVLAQGDFFFGSTVTWISERRELFNDTYSIIDGQQRLTTSAIMLSAIRDSFQELVSESGKAAEAKAADSQATATQRYLITTDDDGNSYPVLRRSEPIFGEQIQHSNALPSGVRLNKSAENIRAAQQFFKHRVHEALSGLSLGAKIESLKSIRANVLKARVIQIELTSEEDGFLIFETLNTRGTDLRLADLVKNLLIRGGASNTQDRGTISKRWADLVHRIEDGRTNPDVDSFIWQSWNSRRDAVKQAELFKEVKELVKSDPSKHIAYLEELEEDSQVYEWLENEDVQPERKVRGVRNPFAVPEFVDSMRALAIFNVTVANTTVIAIARKFKTCSFMKESQLIESIKLVENFHFQFSALTNSGSTGGTRGRYNWFAVRLEAANSTTDVGSAIAELRSRLRDSLPTKDRTESAFMELFYAPGLKLNQKQKVRARKLFIAYVLMAFANAKKRIPAGQNLASWSIEHIKPQALGSGTYKDSVYSIGNLTLLTSSLNNQLGDSSLAAKIDELRKGNAYFDPALESWAQSGLDSPSDSQIRERSAMLAEVALNEVWAL